MWDVVVGLGRQAARAHDGRPLAARDADLGLGLAGGDVEGLHGDEAALVLLLDMLVEVRRRDLGEEDAVGQDAVGARAADAPAGAHARRHPRLPRGGRLGGVGARLRGLARVGLADAPAGGLRRRDHLGLAVAVVVAGAADEGHVKDLGGDADEDEADRGHAGADDADGDLDRRPHGDAKVVPGQVGGLAELDEGGEADDADNGDERADAEHEGHADLLLPVQVELAQLRQRDPEHEQVQRDAHGRVGPRHGADVDALPAALAAPVGPVVADRAALQQRRDDEGEAEHDVKGHGAEDDSPDALAGEDALRKELANKRISLSSFI